MGAAMTTAEAMRISYDDLDRACEVALNIGGWSYEEAELMSRALLAFKDGASGLLRLEDGALLVLSAKEGP